MDALPPLHALRAFDAAGRWSSVTLAAVELHVTAAAISRQIRLLEEHLGIKLFYRQHRSIVLTPKGSEYHVEVARIFSNLRQATYNLRGKDKPRVFNIRAPHTIAMRWLLPKLAGLHSTHPDFEVRLHTSVAPPDFEHEDIDAGIILCKGEAKGMACHKIMLNEIAPVCTPEIARRLQHPSQLADETLLHTHARPDDWHAWFNATDLPDLDVDRGMRYESSALAYEAALAGYGVAIGQKILINKELQSGLLIALFERWVDLGDYSYYFVMPRESYKRKSQEQVAFRSWIASLSID